MTSGEEAGLAMSLISEATCPMCSSLFQDPVRLDCEHNYCRQCILDYWKTGERKEEVEMEGRDSIGYTCPLCREVFPQFALKSNKLLATIVERVRGLGLQHHKAPAEERRKDMSPEKGDDGEGKGSCAVHREPLKMYCLEDQMAICVVCAVSKEHRAHSLAPMEEILMQCEENFQTAVRHFEKQREDVEKFHQRRTREIEEIKSQSLFLHAHIVRETENLQQCVLRERERLCSLLQEDTQRLLNLRQGASSRLSQEVDTLQKEISKIRGRFGKEVCDPAALIKDIQEVTVRLKGELSVLDDNAAELFDLGVYKGPIQYIVWRKLEEIIQPGLCSLNFDPATANPFLSLSDDLTAAQYSHTPKEGLGMGDARFEFSPCVLASRGFTSGRHYWEVDVGDQADWDLGVAGEAAERGGWVVLGPENGYWTVGNKGVRRVGVYLDYEGGQLSFYNIADMTPLFSYLGESFTETLYPFFYPSADPKAQPLKLLNPRAEKLY